ncbi:MAG: biotin--[acetyl-CoA-carboxylase] ligase [Pseudomonadota bacterium]
MTIKILSSNLVHITKILSDLNYHDGDSIGAQLGITRSAVWKAIKKLEEYGVEVVSVKNKGYQLKETLLLIDQAKIEEALAMPDVEIKVFENIDSTNNYLKKNIDPRKRKIYIAETQTNGKGRMGRFWHSPFGQNIYMSYLYNFKKDVSELNGLSLVVGMACLAAIKEIGIEAEIKLKWPNDGVYLKQKFMGNLIELQSESYGDSSAIIGIGINVNMLKDSSYITQNWTSLRKISRKYIDRTKLCIAIIHNLNFYLEQFTKYGLKEFLVKWQELDSLYNQEVKINNGEYEGISKGINEHGNLMLELPTGVIKSISSGDTCV